MNKTIENALYSFILPTTPVERICARYVLSSYLHFLITGQYEYSLYSTACYINYIIAFSQFLKRK